MNDVKTHSQTALEWLSEGKTVLLGGKEVTKDGCFFFWNGRAWYADEFDAIAKGFIDAGLPLDCKEPEPKVRVRMIRYNGTVSGYTYICCDVKGNVTEAQVKAALESIGENQ